MSTVDSPGWREQYPAAQYVAPFAVFLFFLAVAGRNPLPPVWEGATRVILLGVLCAFCWPRELSIIPRQWVASVAIGTATFVLWIAPDLLIPGYRSLPWFSNAVVGGVHSSLSAAALGSPAVLFWRTLRAVLIVPIVEELFWRGWLMRWLVNSDFRRVPLGTYQPIAFWITAILFASEHGPYWDVGLLTGVIYNSWMIRSKSLADCVLMHAITNGLLCAYVISARQWQYWQ